MKMVCVSMCIEPIVFSVVMSQNNTLGVNLGILFCKFDSTLELRDYLAKLVRSLKSLNMIQGYLQKDFGLCWR